MLITRRQLVVGAGAGLACGAALGSYAFALEPMFRLDVADYALTPHGWPQDLSLKIAVLADIHAIEPWMTADRIARIAQFTNGLGADLILLAGDYETGLTQFRRISRDVPMADCAEALAALEAPLGVFSVLGNHDIWVNDAIDVRQAFDGRRIPILENDAVRLTKDGRPFWLLGLGDQLGHWGGGNIWYGRDDLPATLAKVKDDAPVILLAHEPDIFPDVPERIALTISGHTHGGQVALPGLGPLVAPFRYGRRYVYGHYREGRKDLLISGGLGMSVVPVRFGRPPEVMVIRLGGVAAAGQMA
jgi:uncharacterized protein